jgi:hypothetical protein
MFVLGEEKLGTLGKRGYFIFQVKTINVRKSLKTWQVLRVRLRDPEDASYAVLHHRNSSPKLMVGRSSAEMFHPFVTELPDRS